MRWRWPRRNAPSGALNRGREIIRQDGGGATLPDGFSGVRASRADPMRALQGRLGHGAPWFGAVTGPTPRNTNFCTRFPS